MLLLLPAVAALALEPGYVDPKTCGGCHQEIAAAYSKTGMGRSFTTAALSVSGTYYHRASNRHYSITGSAMRRHQVDAQGAEVNVVEKRIDAVMGSGNHARTLLHRAAAGRWLQLPVGWYAEDGGWAMSPGYDRPDHFDFRRVISEQCLFCHSAYPAAWNKGEPAAIDCQRCHGPGEEHVRQQGKSGILNPARLPLARQTEVCMQCHLETASQGIPNSILRAGRTMFSYRPTEPLSDYIVHFDHGEGHADKFEINHAAYRMRQSRCQPLTCTTCHDPHTAGPRVSWRAVCQGCHSSGHSKARTGPAGPPPAEGTRGGSSPPGSVVRASSSKARTGPAGPPTLEEARGGSSPPGSVVRASSSKEATDCAGCHMPKRRTEDAVHVVMTDHRIQRQAHAGLTAPRRENPQAYQGPVIAYYPDQPGALYQAMAQVREFNNMGPGAAALEAAIRKEKPSSYIFSFQLGEAARAAGQPGRAERWYREALARDPGNQRVLASLGDALLRQGKTREAAGVLEKSGNRMSLAVAYGQLGRLADALRLLRAYLDEEPDSPLGWFNLGVTLEQSGDTAGAAHAYTEAIRHQPDMARARQQREALKTR